MSDTHDDGGPAFPTDALQTARSERGMSLRDYFAGQALLFLGSKDAVHAVAYVANEERRERLPVIAAAAYELADALLKVRSQ